MKKILLDTDIGSDIDDALCLAYLLSHPECDLLGITTVSGEAQKRAELASVLCKTAGRDIPIYPGCEDPILGPQLQPFAQQHTRIPGWEHESNFVQNEAISFLQKTIRANPGEITLLAIGPLTNIALLFALDKEIPSMLKELVLMCGRFENRIAGLPLSEWNARCDAYASAVVYRAKPLRFRSIGLDVTLQLQMTNEEYKLAFGADILKPVKDFADEWFKQAGTITFHDPLAAAVIFEEDLCTYSRGNVGIELVSEPLLGMTHFVRDEAGNTEIAQTVDKTLFFRHFFGVINKL